MCRVAWYNLKTSQYYFKPCSEAFIPLISRSFPPIKCGFFFLPGYEKCGFWVKRSLWLWFQSICWNSRGNHFSSNPLIIWPKTKKTGAKPISHWLPLPRQSGGIFLGHEAGVPISFSTWILHFYAQAELFMHLKLQKWRGGLKQMWKVAHQPHRTASAALPCVSCPLWAPCCPLWWSDTPGRAAASSGRCCSGPGRRGQQTKGDLWWRAEW